MSFDRCQKCGSQNIIRIGMSTLASSDNVLCLNCKTRGFLNSRTLTKEEFCETLKSWKRDLQKEIKRYQKQIEKLETEIFVIDQALEKEK